MTTPTKAKAKKEEPAVPNFEVLENLKLTEEDAWKVISRSQSEDHVSITRGFQVPSGCLVRVTTYYLASVAEAIAFVPTCRLNLDDATGLYVIG